MIEQMINGILIVFDGIDGVGKTTQVNLLFKALRLANIDTVISKEPTSGKWGKLIKSSALNGRLPLDKELEYFIKDRQEHTETFIRPSLQAGKVVILDRYYYSTIAYQGARKADVSAVREEVEGMAIKPDISFILNCDVYTALGRIINSRGETPNEFEKGDYLSEVQEVFLSLCDIEPEIVKVNSQNSIGHIHETVFNKVVNGPLKKNLCNKKYASDCYYCGDRITALCLWYKAMGSLKTICTPES